MTEEDVSSLDDQISAFSFDPSVTDLYVRTVVKVQATKQVVKYQKLKARKRVYYYLTNLEPDMDVDGIKIKIIEEQYLLINRDKQTILVINNVPNKKEKLFSRDVNKLASMQEKSYDIWKFNQFRFGEIAYNSDDSANFIFHDVLNWKTNHIWYIKKSEDEGEILLKRFGEKDAYSEMVREIRPTYPFDMKFRKITDYKFILKDNRKGFREASTMSEIKNDQMRLYRFNKKWHLVFQLSNPPAGMNPFIVFENGTVYAAPYFGEW